MKRLMAAVLAVFALLILTGCTRRQQEPNGIVEAVAAGYQTVDQSGENRVQVASGENQLGIVQVDMFSETGTLMRPYIFVEPGVDFYKVEHSEASFGSLFMSTVEILSRMQQSEQHRDVTKLMDETKLPEGVDPTKAGFMNMGYVADPQRKCEIIFTGMTDTGEEIPLRDEVYAFCRLPMMDAGNTPMIMSVLVADQNAVYAIAQKVHQTGMLPKGVEAWMLRKLGY